MCAWAQKHLSGLKLDISCEVEDWFCVSDIFLFPDYPWSWTQKVFAGPRSPLSAEECWHGSRQMTLCFGTLASRCYVSCSLDCPGLPMPQNFLCTYWGVTLHFFLLYSRFDEADFSNIVQHRDVQTLKISSKRNIIHFMYVLQVFNLCWFSRISCVGFFWLWCAIWDILQALKFQVFQDMGRTSAKFHFHL